MARLNEPPMSTDNVETLRRKFLRQNREFAKLNANQSQRIRELENDCARMLSENLDLHGQIWRLEKELESNSAQRISDHALEVKAKMEAHLAELGSLLAGLGLEPPTKRRSPAGRKIAHAKPGLSRSPRQRKPRNGAKDSDELAIQEGRLPSIHENKMYPRATLNSEEIRALCSEAAGAADSPDLGPPPISRFVDEDPVKVESPREPTNDDDKPKSAIDESTGKTADSTPLPKLDFTKKPAFDGVTKRLNETSAPLKSGRAAQETTSSLPPHTLRPGAKRKYGDENDVTTVARSPEKPNPVEVTKEKRGHLPELQKQKGIKSLAAGGRTHKEKTRGLVVGTANPRRALAAKSTNEDVSSPKKHARDAKFEVLKEGKPQSLRGDISKERSIPRKTPASIDTSDPPAPPVVTTISEPETPPPDIPLPIPGTPDHSAPRDATRDTPPPADISVIGETSRPSRRARASISYAEPNLRDKMRRPTKELTDAVSGEGRSLHKSGQKPDGQFTSSISRASCESETSGSWKDLSAADALAKESARRHSAMSPLATKESTADAIPTTLTAGRKRRVSSIGTKESLGPMEKSDNSKHRDSSRDTSAPATVADISGDGDVYDFTTSSPMSETKDPHRDGEGATITVRQPSRHPRSSASATDNTSSSDLIPPAKPPKISASRKRTSMAAPKKASLLELDEPDESVGDDEGASARGRVSRRRSMML